MSRFPGFARGVFGAGWLWIAGLVLAVAVGSIAAWKQWGHWIAERPEHRLTEESLIVTEQPDWIDPSTRVKHEAIRDGGLLEVNVLDEQAAVKIARAFELHTWVRRVIRVRKRAPAAVEVELEYRRPVALVEVIFNKILSYEPVDADGVVLPEDRFHRDSGLLDRFPKITTDYSMPSGPLGTVWNDERIVGAARIAAVLEKAWAPWNLYRIVAVEPSSSGGMPAYELRTRGASRVLWGHAPGSEPQGEPDSVRKVEWIAEFVRQNGPFDPSGKEPLVLDVRNSTGLRTANAPPMPGTEPNPTR
ncbi:MAG: hypothetical protein FJ297_10000 [Planctomycetes bacterium]|nr:hypothetical protein [Planctomycetota bacterium]